MLICEMDENCMQAESLLAVIADMIENHVTSQEQENAEVSEFL